MRISLVSAVPLALAIGAWATPTKAANACIDQPDEHSVRDCLGRSHIAAEQSLQVVLNRAHALADQRRRVLLDASQSAWVTYRDKECEFQGDGFRGGTLQSDQASSCITAKDAERVQELDNDVDLAAH